MGRIVYVGHVASSSSDVPFTELLIFQSGVCIARKLAMNRNSHKNFLETPFYVFFFCSVVPTAEIIMHHIYIVISKTYCLGIGSLSNCYMCFIVSGDIFQYSVL